MMAHVVAAMAVGAIAAALAGVPLVKFLFRSARPDLLFRVGAAGTLVVATLFWLWITRNAPDRRFDVAWAATLGWLGSLIGLKIAAWETDEAKRRSAAEQAAPADGQEPFAFDAEMGDGARHLQYGRVALEPPRRRQSLPPPPNGFFDPRIVSRIGTAPKPSSRRRPFTR